MTASSRPTAAWVALAAGLLSLLCALAAPLLPVRQDVATVDWAARDGNVSLPLISYLPEHLDATIGCSTLRAATTSHSHDDGRREHRTLFTTLPRSSSSAAAEGLIVERIATPEGPAVRVTSRNREILTVPASVLSTDCSALTVSVTPTGVTAHYGSGEGALSGSSDLLARPHVVGLFTDASDPAGIAAHVVADTRFSTTPTALKLTVMLLAVVGAIIAFAALAVIDRRDGRRRSPLVRSWRPTWADGAVTVTLGLWHIIGANTSDDGYLLGMARVADHAGYMANYFRWLGVPESPIGWYYHLLTLSTHLSTASPLIRIPTLLCGIGTWILVSRALLPRLGRALARPSATWTAAAVFLAFWMAYNNGLRPEPLEALFFVLTWALAEKAIATGRLLPGATALLIASFGVGVGPTGIAGVAILLACARAYFPTLRRRARDCGWLPILAALGAASTVVIVTVVADQSLAAVLDATRVRTEIGPNLGWFDEKARWIQLLEAQETGSVPRRVPMLLLLASLGIGGAVLLRRGRLRGISPGPAHRALGLTLGMLLLLALTPTKWTHHFGAFAGIGAVVCGLAVVLGHDGISRGRHQWLVAAGILGVSALAFTSVNEWYYVSTFGIPFATTFPAIAGTALSSWLLLAALGCGVVAATLHLFAPATPRWLALCSRGPRLPIVPLIASAVVVMNLFSFAIAAKNQYPAFSVADANARALAGKPCALADDVLVETDTAESLLRPLSAGPLTSATPPREATRQMTGFATASVPSDLKDNRTAPDTGDAPVVPDRVDPTVPPFGLPKDVPTVSSYRDVDDGQTDAHLTSAWFGLPEATQRDADHPLLILSAAGRYAPEQIRLEWTDTSRPTDTTEPLGAAHPDAAGPLPGWRNLTLPFTSVPAEATAVRIVVDDSDLNPDQWIALTPPRVPTLKTLEQVVGRTNPVLIDWTVGLAFPCQRPAAHRDGVLELPEWRIMPPADHVEAANAWQDRFGGGLLGITDVALRAVVVPTYLRDDWLRDWGSLYRFTPRTPDARPADLIITEFTRSGLDRPGPLRTSIPTPAM